MQACSFGAIHCIQCDSVKEALALYPEEYDKIKYDLRLAFDITRQVCLYLVCFVLRKIRITLIFSMLLNPMIFNNFIHDSLKIS